MYHWHSGENGERKGTESSGQLGGIEIFSFGQESKDGDEHTNKQNRGLKGEQLKIDVNDEENIL